MLMKEEKNINHSDERAKVWRLKKAEGGTAVH